MNLKSKQKGLSALGVLCLFIVIGFLMMIILKLGPHYLHFNTVKTVLRNATVSIDVDDVSENQVIKRIEKGLRVNLSGAFDYREDMIVDLEAKEIFVDYEVREPLFGNVDVILKFNYVHILK